MEYTLKIQFGDTDPAGIVYYPNYYRWMDNATHALFAKLGFPTIEMMEANFNVPLLETHCEFSSPGYFHHDITIKTEVEYVKEKVFKLVHSFYDEKTLLAKGYEVRAWVSFIDGKLKAENMPTQLQHKLRNVK